MEAFSRVEKSLCIVSVFRDCKSESVCVQIKKDRQQKPNSMCVDFHTGQPEIDTFRESRFTYRWYKTPTFVET